ncbi:hypothetical protein MXAN_0310 [Myxococcus xanthus DK 1622]|uniref:Uncharacterized protein n=1 Tax=Myxococcus xanthus (strain DK1622) TaxID=246197 RepID=Q1DFI3_MYXXD|nr:hypothetical protein MXAN_0310 [Myxococcus xanthus DK 1622]
MDDVLVDGAGQLVPCEQLLHEHRHLIHALLGGAQVHAGQALVQLMAQRRHLAPDGRVRVVVAHGHVEHVPQPGHAVLEEHAVALHLEEGAARVGHQLLVQHPGGNLPEVLQLHGAVAAEEGHGLREVEDGLVRAHADAVLRLRAEVDLLVQRALLVAHRGHRLPGQLERVLVLELEARRGHAAEVQLPQEEGDALQHVLGHLHFQDGGVGALQLARREDDFLGQQLLGGLVGLQALEELVHEARVEGHRAHHHVDAVLQRLDDLEGAAALVVVGGEEPGRAARVDVLVHHLRVALRHEGQERGLRLGGDAVVLVDDFDALANPLAPAHLHRGQVLRLEHVGGQRRAQQVRDGELRVPALDAAVDLVAAHAGQQGHEDGGRRLPASRSAHQQRAPAGEEGEQGDEDERAVAGVLGEVELVTRRRLEGRGRAELQVVVGTDDGVVGDPPIRLPHLVVEAAAVALGEVDIELLVRRRAPGEQARHPVLVGHARRSLSPRGNAT